MKSGRAKQEGQKHNKKMTVVGLSPFHCLPALNLDSFNTKERLNDSIYPKVVIRHKRMPNKVIGSN